MKTLVGRKAKAEKVEQLLLENYDRYYRLAFSYVHNADDAGDIVQNGAYKAIRSSGSLKNQEYAATWVYRIMLNEIMSFFRQRRTVSVEALEEAGEAEPSGMDTYQDFDLRSALDTLGLEDKLVVELRYFEDMKLEEIAEILNENLSTVKSRLYRSLRKLRVKLSEGERIV